MAYCSQCGQASNGAFCPQCGSPMAAAQPQAAAPTPQGYPPHQPQPQQQAYYAPPPARKRNSLLIGLGIGGGILAVVGIVAVVLFNTGIGSTPVAPPDSSSPTSNPGASKPSSTPPSSSPGTAGKVTRKPGYVTGIVVDERGAPLKVSSDKVTIRVSGTRSSDRQQMVGNASIQADGRFEMKVPDGDYSVDGFVAVNFDGKEFWLTLDPVGGQGPHPSKDGIAKEMRLKLTGQRPGQPAGNPYSYYGGHIRIQYQGQTLPDDAQVKFTLTPTTPLADGSQGKPLSFTATGQQLRSNAPFRDIPLAKYRITGEVTLANGTKKVALISLAGTQPAPAQELTFQPNTTGEGIEGVYLWVKGEQ